MITSSDALASVPGLMLVRSGSLDHLLNQKPGDSRARSALHDVLAHLFRSLAHGLGATQTEHNATDVRLVGDVRRMNLQRDCTAKPCRHGRRVGLARAEFGARCL